MREFFRCTSCNQFNLVPSMELSKEQKIKLRELKEEHAILYKKAELLFDNGIAKSPEAHKALHEAHKVKNKINELTTKRELKLLYQKLDAECSHCGAKKFLPPGEEDYIKLGHRLYKEYLTFMGFTGSNRNKMPAEIDIRIGDKNCSTGQCIYDKEVDKFVIIIRKDIVMIYNNMPSIFYHEFTHIYDGYNTNTLKQKEEKDLLHWYTEFNASEIEMKKMLGFKSYNDDKMFRLSTKVYRDFKSITLKEYLDAEAQGFIREITKYYKDELTLESITSILRYLMYFRSKINFCKKYLDCNSIKFLPRADMIENLLEELLGKDEELLRLFKLLDDCITVPDGKVDKHLLNKTVYDIQHRLISFVPKLEHLRNFNAFTEYLAKKKNNKEAI